MSSEAILPTAAQLQFKIASEPHEFEQIARLNHQTFAEELPQHAPDPTGRRIDRFHAENTYAVCLRTAGGADGRSELIGMVAARGRRPFSLDEKLPDLDRYLPSGRRVCEIRLLATQRRHRGGRVFLGLLRTICTHCLREGYDLAVISGTTRQLQLYRHVGFVPFGPLVGSNGVMFQPMYLTLEALRRRLGRLLPLRPIAAAAGEAPRIVSFLPGPVEVSEAVRHAFAAAAVSHRERSFMRDVGQCARRCAR